MPVLIFFSKMSYLDLYVFFYVKIYVLFIFIPVSIVVYVLFLPFAFSEIELGQRFAKRRNIRGMWRRSVHCQSRKDYMLSWHKEKTFGLKGNNVYYPFELGTSSYFLRINGPPNFWGGLILISYLWTSLIFLNEDSWSW